MTLVAVTGVARTATAAALERTLAQTSFARALLLSDEMPSGGVAPGIEWRQIQPLRSYGDYSRFLFRQLGAHIETSHMLIVQWDGFAIDGSCWDPGFLDHDFIGAPWPHHADAHTVGNGGFSLRSTRLMELCTRLDLDPGETEDLALCHQFRPLLEGSYGIRYAPLDVASRFSFERSVPTGTTFGFHGAFNLPREIGTDATFALLDTLEYQIVRPNEARSLAALALRHGQTRLAWKLMRRCWRPSAQTDATGLDLCA